MSIPFAITQIRRTNSCIMEALAITVQLKSTGQRNEKITILNQTNTVYPIKYVTQ